MRLWGSHSIEAAATEAALLSGFALPTKLPLACCACVAVGCRNDTLPLPCCLCCAAPTMLRQPTHSAQSAHTCSDPHPPTHLCVLSQQPPSLQFCLPAPIGTLRFPPTLPIVLLTARPLPPTRFFRSMHHDAVTRQNGLPGRNKLGAATEQREQNVQEQGRRCTESAQGRLPREAGREWKS